MIYNPLHTRGDFSYVEVEPHPPDLHAKCALVNFGRKENNNWYRL